MAEFRSYAQPGQFRQPVKVSNKAKAKRVRDKEMVGELKDQNVALYNRDQEFKQAMMRKLDVEKKSRDAAEKGRRESVEAERKQRVANAKLAADFAEKEAKANNATWQALAELVPSIGESLKTVADKRYEFDATEAYNALEKSGSTPQEIRSALDLKLTNDEYAVSNHFTILKMREAGISSSQYNRLVKDTGAYGAAFDQWEVFRAGAGWNDYLNSHMDKKYDGKNTLRDMLTSTALDVTDRRAYGELVDKHYKEVSNLINYEPTFIKGVLQGKHENQLNDFYSKLAEKQEEQASNAAYTKDKQNLIVKVQTNELQEHIKHLNNTHGTQASYFYFKKQLPYILEGIEEGSLGEAYHQQLLSLSLPNQQGVMIRIDGSDGDFSRKGIHAAIEDAINKERHNSLQVSKLTRAEKVSAAQKESDESVKVLMTLDGDEYTAHVMAQMKRFSGNPYATEQLKFWRTLLEDPVDKNKNLLGKQRITQLKLQQGFVTEDQAKQWLTGDALITELGAISRNQANDPQQAQQLKDVKSAFKSILGQKVKFHDILNPNAKSHPEADFALTHAVNRYVEIRRQILATQKDKNPELAHSEALGAVKLEIQEGFTKGTGDFAWESDEGATGISGRFINPMWTGTTPATGPALQEDLKKDFKQLGLGMYHSSEIFTRNELNTLTQNPLTSHLLKRAEEVGRWGNVKPRQVIAFQYNRLGMEVPTTVADAVPAEKKVYELGDKSKKFFEEASTHLTNGNNEDYNTARKAWLIDQSGTSRNPENINPAITGNSGRSTGPHLDFGATDASGNEVDPTRYLDSLYVGGTLLKDLYPETSGYGWRLDPFSGALKWHGAKDIGTPMGTEITVKGGVLIDQFNDEGGWGHTKVYRMPDNGTIRLSHLLGGNS